MLKVHQCEQLKKKKNYVFIHNEGYDYEKYAYELERVDKKLEGRLVDWSNCPYCGEELDE
jgi:hypothetical protein